MSQRNLAKNEHRGIAVSPGVVKGRVLVYSTEVPNVPRRELKPEEIEKEIDRLKKAIEKTRSDLLSFVQEQEPSAREIAAILNSHIQLLQDPAFFDGTVEQIKSKKINAEFAFYLHIIGFVSRLRQLPQQIGERHLEIVQDISKRVMHNLLGSSEQTLSNLTEPTIVVAHDLSPSETATMNREKVIAFATEIGGPTSHTAIMARSLEIPAVVGIRGITEMLRNGDTVILDGNRGVVTINPDAVELEDFEKARQEFFELEQVLDQLRDLEAETLDGHRIELSANIELPEEVTSAKRHGARGIGLFRTEYLYLTRDDLPSEDEQYELYRKVLEEMAPDPVIIRTLDLGGDKFASQIHTPQEMNPFLGWRAIRFCLDAGKSIFVTQLRGILRASVHGRARIMFPMISGVHEIHQCRELLFEIMDDFDQKGIPFDRGVHVGAMIEVPSAALTADALAREVDFFSIGTNDLIQYTLAVDRNNERMAYLYEPLHPAVLRLIRNTVEAAHSAGLWVGVCGEVAGDPSKTLVLLALGVNELSMSPVAVPEVKKVIRSLKYEDIKDLSEEIFKRNSVEEVRSLIGELNSELLTNASFCDLPGNRVGG